MNDFDVGDWRRPDYSEQAGGDYRQRLDIGYGESRVSVVDGVFLMARIRRAKQRLVRAEARRLRGVQRRAAALRSALEGEQDADAR